LDVLANDTFAPDTGETLTVTVVTQPANGTVTLTGGVVSFTPTAGFAGTTTFTYTISDGNGGSDTATVTVRVGMPANNPPDAVDDSFTVAEDSGATTLDVLANDTFAPDVGETLTVTAVTQPTPATGGTVTLAAGVVSFTPTANFNGTVTFTYTVGDGNGGSDTATVTVTVTPVNDPPTGRPDTFTVVANSGATVLNVLANDSSAPDTGETLTVTAVTRPASGGTVTLTGGVVSFTPSPGFVGTLNFFYTLSDGTSTVEVPVTVLVIRGEDSDGDGLSDAIEEANGTNPLDDDTDNDGIKDGTEDVSRDGRVDLGETDPRKFDTDEDGLSDGLERSLTAPEGDDTDLSAFVADTDPTTKTDPLVADSDNDELIDGDEDANHNGRLDADETDPNDPDTDDGGALDGVETEGGSNPLDDSDDFIIGGSGCASTGASSLAPLLLLLGLPLLRRRRAAGGALASRAGSWGLLGVLAVLLAAPARAQPTPSPTSEQIDVQQFKPGPGAYDVLGLQSARVNRHLGWNLGLSVSYAKDPLIFLDPRESTTVYKLVENQLTVDVMGAIAFLDRFELGVAIPITSQTSQSSPTFAPILAEGVGKTGLGDVRLVPKASLYSTGGLILGAALPIHLPTGGDASFLGGGFSVRPRLLGEWSSSTGIRVLANLGMNLRSKQQLRNLVVSNELTYGLGTEVPFQVSGRELAVGGTLMGAMGLGQKGAEERPLELLATAKYRVTDAIAAHLGGGPGIGNGYGTPGFRLFAGVAYVPPMSQAESRPEPRPEPKVEPKPKPDEPKIKVEVIPPPPKPVCPEGPEDLDGFMDEDGCADLDNDADGILDASDKCLNEAESKNGFEDEDGCPDQLPPPPDTDGDGLVDPSDRCPQAAEDKDGFEDEDGCPDVDNDRDGVVDTADKCPKEPETINGVKDDDGCPDKGKVKVLVEGEKIVILDKIFFSNSKATILPKSFPLLRQVTQVLQANPQIEKVRVEGYTDDRGEDGANLVLSRSRAEAVRDRLVMEGIDGSRLEAVGYGEAKPVASNKTSKGREQNRRVEFTIVKVKPKEVEIEQP
ncbi:Ig-like domain-containing protein, partial [Hyalangium sp.]|uniref:Ig-like domain-containing protein n=1 Tax=Hyalangium sp. TaxID=2028555 RepID=UPI002D25442D